MRCYTMRKKLFLLLITSAVFACGCQTSNDANTEKIDTQTDSELSSLESLGDVEIEKNLFSVELTIPADYVGETTQEELDKMCKENGYKSIILNADGSATYTMTKTQHKKMLKEISDSIDASLSELVASEEYPNFTEISANENYTKFTIKTTSTELDMSESFSILVFYTYGGMYNIFKGETVENIHIDFVNANSGEIISSSDSNTAE